MLVFSYLLALLSCFVEALFDKKMSQQISYLKWDLAPTLLILHKKGYKGKYEEHFMKIYFS